MVTRIVSGESPSQLVKTGPGAGHPSLRTELQTDPTENISFPRATLREVKGVDNIVVTWFGLEIFAQYLIACSRYKLLSLRRTLIYTEM